MPRVNTTRNRILGFFSELGEGIPISVRMLFCFGKEAQVYKIASELVKRHKLSRVTWGIYMLPTKDGSLPSEEEVALAKARGFGKKIYTLDEEIKHETANLKVMKGNPIALYATSGSSSSFKYNGGKIVFYKMANRKIELLRKRIGKVYTSFWKLFTRNKNQMDNKFEEAQISDEDKRFTPRLLELMPMWLKSSLRELYKEVPWELSLSEAIIHSKAQSYDPSRPEPKLSYVLFAP